jgi:preprotein translocase SecF subunit
MFKLVERRRYYFLFSGILILVGLATLIFSTISTGTPMQLSIDFTGGTLLSIQFENAVDEQDIRDVLKDFNLDDIIVQKLSAVDPPELDENSRWSINTETLLTDDEFDSLINSLATVAQIDETASSHRQIEDGGIVIVQFDSSVDAEALTTVLTEYNESNVNVPTLLNVESLAVLTIPTEYPDGSRWSIRTDELSVDQVLDIESRLENEVAPLDRTATENSQVSESVGREVTVAALVATLAAAIVILGWIYFAFRKVPHPFRYGACAIIAMIHDILVMISAMSIMGLILDWQVDALFLTALLTVVGFSVQDSIVVFDRIRENIPRRRGESYELIVNRSVLETIHRSLATQLNAIFVMIAIVLFGGETIRQFVVILLVGLTSGTYSSIFIAVPLLVAWSKGEIPFVNQGGVIE